MENLTELLKKLRKFLDESDYELYANIIDKIYNGLISTDVTPFFYGFDDEIFSESIIMSFIESIFWYPISSKKYH